MTRYPLTSGSANKGAVTSRDGMSTSFAGRGRTLEPVFAGGGRTAGLNALICAADSGRAFAALGNGALPDFGHVHHNTPAPAPASTNTTAATLHNR